MNYKQIRVTSLILLTIIFLFSLSIPTHAELAEEKEWTFMLFSASDNNLEDAIIGDMNELEKYGSTDQINFVAQIDRSGNYSGDSEVKWSGARRFFVEKDESSKMTSPMLENLGIIDMNDSKTLVDFVIWAKENFPAKKYALILWSHGTGWKEIQPSIMEGSGDIGLSSANISYNISYDDSSKSSMTIPVLGKTLERIKSVLGQPIDILGFDACLMQMAEVTWTCAPHILFQVASPDRGPNRGWPYDMIAGSLTKKPEIEARELSEIIAETYNRSYNGGSQGNTAAVLSVVDMKKTKAFKRALDNFCNSARRNIHEIDKYEAARDQAFKYYYGDYVDLGHYLKLLIKSKPNKETMSAARSLLRCIVGDKRSSGYICNLEKSGEKFDDSTGMSIFFPARQGFKIYRLRYKEQVLAQETEWYNFLSEIAVPNMPYLKVEDIILEDNNKDGRIAPGEEVKVLLSIRNLGRKSLKDASVYCVTDSDFLVGNEFSAELTKLPAPNKVALIPAFKFTVKEETPVHSEISIKLTLSGEKLPDSNIKTSFLIKDQFSSLGHALLVITDHFSPASPVLQQMLQSTGVKFDVWDRAFDGELRPEVLKRYVDGWVLVTCQDSTDEQTLSEDEIGALDAYLKTGGRLVLNGQDLAFTLRDNPFLASRCKVRFIQDDVNVHVLSGTKDFAENRMFQISGGDGANNQKWPDEIDPLPGAEAIVKYEEGVKDVADEREMNGPSHKDSSFTRGINSSGVAGVSVLDGYRLMLFSFGIEAIDNNSQRRAIMKDIASFMRPSISDEIQSFAKAASKRIPKKQVTERVLLERADLLSSIEKRLIKQIKEEIGANPQRTKKVLGEIQSLPTKERKALSNLEKNVRALLDFEDQYGTLRR